MRRAHNRLGMSGIDAVKNHPWFADFDWDALRTKKMKAPFVPDASKSNYDDNHVNKKAWNDTEDIIENQKLLRRQSRKGVFDTYFYDKNKMVPMRSSMISAKSLELKEDDVIPDTTVNISTMSQAASVFVAPSSDADTEQSKK